MYEEKFTANPNHPNDPIVPEGDGPELVVPPSGQTMTQDDMKKAAGKPAPKPAVQPAAKTKTPAPAAHVATEPKAAKYDPNSAEERLYRHQTGETGKKPKAIQYLGNGPELAVPPSGQMMDLATMEKAAGHIRKESEINKPLAQMNEADMEVWLSNSKNQEEWNARAQKIRTHNGGQLPGRVNGRLIAGVDPLFIPKNA